MQIFKHKYKFLLSLILLVLISHQLQAQRNIPARPQKQTSVYDYANMLSQQEQQQLEHKLIHYFDTTSTQIVVVLLPSLKGEYIGTYAAEWAHEWGVGSKQDNGILMMASKEDRKFWITTGYGIESILTDAKTSLIYNRIIKPQFQRENYYQGLDEGTSAIFQVLAGEFNPQSKKAEEQFPFGALMLLFFIIFLVILVLYKAGKHGGDGGSGGRKSNDGWLFDAILLSSLGRNSGRGFGGGLGGGGNFGGGGGFGGGFGGGRFGGGGAGGSW